MQGNFLASVTVAISATLGVAIPAAAQTAPPMGGGYTNVIPIPVDDPTTKAIAGALFKPTGTGPFPAVVYISGCNGVFPTDLTKATIDRLLSKGVATLIIDPFTPRNETQGICPTMANLNDKSDAQFKYLARGGNDALAAVKVLQAMPDIDANHVFLLGYSYGAIASLSATNKKIRRTMPKSRALSHTIRSATKTMIHRFPFSFWLARKTTGHRPRVVGRSRAKPISRSSSIPALRMPSTYLLRSLWRCWGITWNTTKRRVKTHNNGPTLSWMRT